MKTLSQLPSMSTEELISQLTAQVVALQAQLAHHSWSPPPPQPSTAQPPPLKPPKVSAPSPFSGVQDNLDCFKAKCSLYLSMRHSEFPDEHSNALFILSYMKGGSAGPWATQKINSILFDAQEVTWAGFVEELNEMFADPNHQATARRKLATLRQGDSSVEELIQEFEIHGPISGLGDVGLVDRFEQAIHPCLCESIYHLEPMPSTWAEWKRKTSLLDNQWRRFRDTQLKATSAKSSSFCPSSVAPFTITTSSASSSNPPAPPAPSGPQPMDLDRTNPVKRDPHSGLCFNCGKPGHIAKVCRGPHTQNIQSVNDTPTLRFAPEDLQLLMESVRVAMVLSVPMMPPCESEGEKTPGEEGFQSHNQ